MKIKKYRNLIKFNKWKKKPILIDIQQSKHFFLGGGWVGWFKTVKQCNELLVFIFFYASCY